MEGILYKIDDLRSKLNKLVSTKDIIANDDDILKISVELDALIYAFICLKEEEK